MPTVSPEPLSIDAFSDLVRRERAALVGVARREGMSAEEALECVQDALSTLLSRDMDGLFVDGQDRVVSTLKVMVRNVARNARRKHARKMRHDPLDADALSSGGDAADEQLAREEDLRRLRACVAELSDVQRAVVTLRLLDEQSGEDVAATLGLSRGYVDVLVHRAKAALSDCMMCLG